MQDDIRQPDALTPAHRELEDALRGIAPASVRISRDRLMYEAGIASARRSTNRWRGASGLLVMCNVIALTVAIRSPFRQSMQPRVQEQMAVAPVGEKQSTTGVSFAISSESLAPAESLPLSTANAGYVSVRNDVLRRGLSALPDSPPRTSMGEPPTLDKLLDTSTPALQTPAFPWSPYTAPLQAIFSGEHL